MTPEFGTPDTRLLDAAVRGELPAPAAHGNHHAAVRALLDGKADPTVRNEEGKTAADVAAEAGHAHLARRLGRPAR